MYSLGTHLQDPLGRTAFSWALTLCFQPEFSYTPKPPKRHCRKKKKAKHLQLAQRSLWNSKRHFILSALGEKKISVSWDKTVTKHWCKKSGLAVPQNIWKVACFSLKTPGSVTESNRCAHLAMQCELYLLTHLCQFSPLPVNKNSREMKQQHLNVISQDHQQVSLSLKRCRLFFSSRTQILSPERKPDTLIPSGIISLPH